LKGHGVARKLTAADLAIATIATVGAEIERQILRNTKEDAAFALALDGYATAAVGALIISFRQYLAELVAAELLTTTTTLYPGTNDWELAADRTIFPCRWGSHRRETHSMVNCIARTQRNHDVRHSWSLTRQVHKF